MKSKREGHAVYENSSLQYEKRRCTGILGWNGKRVRRFAWKEKNENHLSLETIGSRRFGIVVNLKANMRPAQANEDPRKANQKTMWRMNEAECGRAGMRRMRAISTVCVKGWEDRWNIS